MDWRETNRDGREQRRVAAVRRGRVLTVRNSSSVLHSTSRCVLKPGHVVAHVHRHKFQRLARPSTLNEIIEEMNKAVVPISAYGACLHLASGEKGA